MKFLIIFMLLGFSSMVRSKCERRLSTIQRVPIEDLPVLVDENDLTDDDTDDDDEDLQSEPPNERTPYDRCAVRVNEKVVQEELYRLAPLTVKEFKSIIPIYCLYLYPKNTNSESSDEED
ncbi:uncharacterized protein [Prorops nasuta]|uniref:uncharacterized protein n=1 Tax=Prorops nasuta TaxID=863751 RepID=UPI0034CF16F0